MVSIFIWGSMCKHLFFTLLALTCTQFCETRTVGPVTRLCSIWPFLTRVLVSWRCVCFKPSNESRLMLDRILAGTGVWTTSSVPENDAGEKIQFNISYTNCFIINAVLLNYLFIKNLEKMYDGFHKNIEKHNFFKMDRNKKCILSTKSAF